VPAIRASTSASQVDEAVCERHEIRLSDYIRESVIDALEADGVQLPLVARQRRLSLKPRNTQRTPEAEPA
jgi:hypothetical protein